MQSDPIRSPLPGESAAAQRQALSGGERVFPVPETWAKRSWIDERTYRREYERSLRDPDGFWAEQATRLDWFRTPDKIRDVSFGPADVHVRWFEDGLLNASFNCLDRHLPLHGHRNAIVWEGDDPYETRAITYAGLHTQVCRLANGLKSLGVRRGDRVIIYLPMVPEAVVAMLACARIGAVHAVAFAGLSSDALAERIQDCGARVVITADGGPRGGRHMPLKANADAALRHCPTVSKCVVLRRTRASVHWDKRRDVWYHELTRDQPDQCAPVAMGATEPLFILYTALAAGKPKGVLHTTGGYLVATSLTHRYVLDHHDDDVFWCSADIGWIAGHSYAVYGPLANGATTVLFEGMPCHPDASRFWQIIDKHRVSVFYTTPAAIRTLMRHGEEPVRKTSRKSLRLLGSVGEPIDPEAWLWYYNMVGEQRCPIVDTWWQTETGGIQIAPLPGAIAAKPGSAALPFFGVEPAIVDEHGQELDGACEGMLCLRRSGPGMMRSVYRDHHRFVRTHFSTYPGLYFTGNGARRDKDGYYWITTGRVDVAAPGERAGSSVIGYQPGT